MIAGALSVPVYTFSHQAGHIMAALYSSDQIALCKKKFLAFHVSGGTTEALLVTPDKEHVFHCELVAASLDLQAGQAVDRVGHVLGLPFPAGPALEKLALALDVDIQQLFRHVRQEETKSRQSEEI